MEYNSRNILLLWSEVINYETQSFIFSFIKKIDSLQFPCKIWFRIKWFIEKYCAMIKIEIMQKKYSITNKSSTEKNCLVARKRRKQRAVTR